MEVFEIVLAQGRTRTARSKLSLMILIGQKNRRIIAWEDAFDVADTFGLLDTLNNKYTLLPNGFRVT